MSQIDGHCATDAEAIYVQNTTPTCKTAFVVGGGTATSPYCSLDPVGLALTDVQSLVVIRGTVNNGGAWIYQRTGHPMTSFIGQQTAVIDSSGTPGFGMSSGTAYIRGVKFSALSSACISATGGTLVADTVVVDSCQGGGILLNGAAFDISNTSVTNNGPGTFNNLTTWGGVLVNNPPAGGPMVLNLDTIQGNKGPGVSCSGQITGTNVYSAGNSTSDIGGSCAFTSCAPAGAGCGAP